MIRLNVRLELSDSGKICKLKTESNRTIAELFVHGYLKRVIENAIDNVPMINGKPNVFRAEVYQLAGYEFLNCDEEMIEEKI